MEQIEPFSKVDWSLPSDFTLSLELFADLGFFTLLKVLSNVKEIDSPNNVGTFYGIQSSS